MTGREPRTVRVDPEVWEDFEQFVIELEGTKRGYRSEHLENALKEYMDHDRHARIEEQVKENTDLLKDLKATLSDSAEHTHTSDDGHVTQASPTVQKTREIADRLNKHYASGLNESELERAIKDIAGSDDRTLRKYKQELRERGHAYEHPSDESEAWFIDRGPWLAVVGKYARMTQRPREVAMDILDEYPVSKDVLGDEVQLADA